MNRLLLYIHQKSIINVVLMTVFSEEIIDTRIYQYVEGTGMLVLLWNQMERKAYVR